MFQIKKKCIFKIFRIILDAFKEINCTLKISVSCNFTIDLETDWYTLVYICIVIWKMLDIYYPYCTSTQLKS